MRKCQIKISLVFVFVFVVILVIMRTKRRAHDSVTTMATFFQISYRELVNKKTIKSLMKKIVKIKFKTQNYLIGNI